MFELNDGGVDRAFAPGPLAAEVPSWGLLLYIEAFGWGAALIVGFAKSGIAASGVIAADGAAPHHRAGTRCRAMP